MITRKLGLAASAAALIALPTAAWAEPNVVVSIKPIHSLVASIMKGVAEPSLIVQGAASPHTYTLKPSDARVLENADAVFWVGHGLEAFLEKPLEALPKNAVVVELEDAPGLTELPFREGGPFEAHDHGDEDHAGHDHHDGEGHDHDDNAKEAAHAHGDHAHDHKDHAHHEHEKAESKEAGHHHDHDHAHGGTDMHMWLDPTNAKAMASQIEKTLIEVDPANKATYEANTKALMAEIDAVDAEIAASLKPVADKPFIVFHDAYQYFERHYNVRVVGSITVSPETMPGAERLSEIQDKISSLNAACVFAEPQFEPKLINVVTEGTSAKHGTLDPEGGALEPGPALYGKLMKNLANSMVECLTQ
ncbi:zinc ABC transporter substrate-binding protein [Peteryoungia desertarenae]|uniref:High-affinity zinc uptake system protein ZnuA n=1 Tax=Peteryoungia desertarenae TaxID=1813451 RepID=A0ABX6QP23_9HYPH|nr:zinc ABC transporter substrate-binding protein [Peteryoungia desertarenae]QLF70358.1 zinc ABC transporter substrate-binding protein [Peteryoungia desertarenae]